MLQNLIDALRLPKSSNGIALPPGTKLVPAELYGTPESAIGRISVESIDGLIDYIEQHLSDTTVVFASLAKMDFSAVFDWHAGDATGWGEHTASFKLEYTKAWKDWMNISGRTLSQVQFAEFIEEHLDGIAEPSAAEVLTVATSLSGMRKVAFTNAVKTINGDTTLQWEETTDAKAAGDVRVPSGLKLRLPVFHGAETSTMFEVSGLFRYRINEGRLTFEVKLLHVEDIAELAFAEVLKNVRARLAAKNKTLPPVIHGAISDAPRLIINKNIHTA